MKMKFKILATTLGLLLLCASVHASTTIVILTSDNEADLAVANVLAETIGAKVIVTPWGTLSDDAIAEIEASGATEVYVIGGEVAVPDVEEKIKITVKRFAGKDRYETSALVAKEWKKRNIKCAEITVAEGHDFAGIKDAMERAKVKKCPVMFIKTDEVPEEVEEVLDELNVNKTVVIEAPNMNKTKIHLKLKVRVKEVEDIKADWQERAQEAIDKAKGVIAEAEETVENITDAKSAAATRLIVVAKYHLEKAETAFEEGKYGKAFGLAIAAKENAESAIKIASGITVGNFGKEIYKWEERIKTKGIEEVKEEICEDAEKFGVEEMKLRIQKQIQIKKKVGKQEGFQQVENKTEEKKKNQQVKAKVGQESNQELVQEVQVEVGMETNLTT